MTRPLPPLGQQLGIFHGKLNLEQEPDCELVMQTIAAAGMTTVEGGPSASPVLRAALARHHLRHAGAHVSMTALEDPEKLANDLLAMGCRDLCNSGILRWHDRTEECYQQSITALNQAGRSLRQRGIHLHYHNHDFEFSERFAAKRGIDLLLEGLDPAACDLCVDVAWVKRGGDDPADFLSRHRQAIGYLHFKDYQQSGDWIELGQGVVDFHAIMRVLPELPAVRLAMIEQDSTAIDPLVSVTQSRAYLRSTFGY